MSTYELSARGRQNSRRRHWLKGFVALGLVLAACGGDEQTTTAASDESAVAVENEQTQEQVVTPTTVNETTTTTTEVQPEESNDEGSEAVASEPMVVDEAVSGPAGFTAAGGISLELPEPVTALSTQNCVILLEPNYEGDSPFEPGIAIGTSAFLGRETLTPISTVDEWFAGYEGQPEPVATGESITFLGEELDGYRIEGAFTDAPTGEESTLNCAVDANTLSDLQVFAAPYSDLYVAETDEGLLFAVANGFTEDEQVRAREILDGVLPTVEIDLSNAPTGVVETVQVELITSEQRDTGVNQVDVLGGLEFELPESTTVTTSGNCLFIEVPGYTGSSPFPPTIGASLVVSSGLTQVGLEPLRTIEDWLALYGDEPAPQPTGETLTFLDEELQEYEIAGAFTTGPPPQESVQNCGSAPDIASDIAFLNAPFGTDFIAETPDGLLSVGYGGFTPEEAELSREFFERVFPTIAAQ